MAYLNTILQLLMVLIFAAQLLVATGVWLLPTTTIWQRLSLAVAALVLGSCQLVIMYGFGYLADTNIPIAWWTWFVLSGAGVSLIATIAGISRRTQAR